MAIKSQFLLLILCTCGTYIKLLFTSQVIIRRNCLGICCLPSFELGISALAFDLWSGGIRFAFVSTALSIGGNFK